VGGNGGGDEKERIEREEKERKMKNGTQVKMNELPKRRMKQKKKD